MDDSETIIRHTITAHGDANHGRRDRSIAWPALHLARDIGPRPAGSSGERKAARFVERELRKLGLDVVNQRFRVPSTTAGSKAIAHFVLLAGAALFTLHRHLSYALVLVGFFSLMLENYGRSPFAWLSAHPQSENVVARIRPVKEPELKLVLVAHLDSHRAGSHDRPEATGLSRGFSLLDFLCQATVFTVFTLAYGGFLLSMDAQKLDFLWKLGLFACIPVFASLVVQVKRALSEKASPGGNFNASGVALLLELANHFSRRQPQRAELWLAFTGASEINGRGVRNLVRHHRKDLRDAYFLVLQGVGRGFPTCTRREGRLIGFRVNRRLERLARHIIDSHAHYSAGLTKNRKSLGEAFQLLSRGYRAITICGVERGHTSRHREKKKDDHMSLDPRSLRLALDFTRSLVEAADHGGLTRNRPRAFRR